MNINAMPNDETPTDSGNIVRYEANIHTPADDLVVKSLIELGPNVSSVVVKRLIFQQPPGAPQGFIFENAKQLEIRAQEIAAEGSVRWKRANQTVIAKPATPPAPASQPPGANGNNDSRTGKAGQQGLAGVKGKDGVAGEDGPSLSIKCDSIVGYLAIDVRGTKGQPGGDGGVGGRGGDGGRGDRGDSDFHQCRRGGAHGGNAGGGGRGGDAGHGGLGGAGGSITIEFSSHYNLALDPIVDGGEGGIAGNPGAGGMPGDPGRGGAGGGWCDDESDRRRGSAAAAGTIGATGRFLGRGPVGNVAVDRLNQAADLSQENQAFTQQIPRNAQGRRPRISISFGVAGVLLFLAATAAMAQGKRPSERPSTPAGRPETSPSPIPNLIGAGTPIKPEDFTVAQRYIPSTSRVSVDGMPVRLGQGYNSVSGQFRGFGVADANQSPVFPAETPSAGSEGRRTANDGQALTYTFEFVENETELRRTLEINASASLNYGAFSGSAKLSLLKQHQENATSSYLVIRAKVVNATQRLNDYTLTPPALAAAAAKDSKLFVRSFGDQFVNGIITGGELTGIVELQFASSTDREEFSGKLKASYGAFASLSVSVKQTMTAMRKNLRVSASLLRVGGTAKVTLVTYKPDTFDIIWEQMDKNMTDLAQAFIEDVKGHPTVLEVTTIDYNACSNAGTTSFPTLTFAKWYYDVFAAAVEELRTAIQDSSDGTARTIAETLPAKRLQALKFLANPIWFDVSAEHLYSYRQPSERLQKALGVVGAIPNVNTKNGHTDSVGAIRTFSAEADPWELLTETRAEITKLRP